MFVLNKHGHYFVIQGAPVNESLLKELGCEIFSTIQELYLAASKKNHIDVDEIEGLEFNFNFEESGWVLYDTRNLGKEVKLVTEEEAAEEEDDLMQHTTIESYMADWEL